LAAPLAPHEHLRPSIGNPTMLILTSAPSPRLEKALPKFHNLLQRNSVRSAPWSLALGPPPSTLSHASPLSAPRTFDRPPLHHRGAARRRTPARLRLAQGETR